MKSAKSILKQYPEIEEKGISLSFLERIMEEYAFQFKPVEHRYLNFESYRLVVILEEVCNFFNISRKEIASKSRKRILTDARAIYARRSRMLYPDASWSEIGALINRDHSSALCARKRAVELKEIRIKYNKCYANQAEIAYSIMASAGGTGIRSVVKTSKGPVVSYGKVEKRGEGVFEKEPALQEVRSTG